MVRDKDVINSFIYSCVLHSIVNALMSVADATM